MDNARPYVWPEVDEDWLWDDEEVEEEEEDGPWHQERSEQFIRRLHEAIHPESSTFTEPASHHTHGHNSSLSNHDTRYRPVPRPSHSEDWLDRGARILANHNGYLYDHLFGSQSELSSQTGAQFHNSALSDFQPSSQLSPASNNNRSPSFVTLDNSEDEVGDFDEDEMPSQSRRARRTSIVDLTQGSSSPPALSRSQDRDQKRPRNGSATAGRAKKRRRTSAGGSEEDDEADEAPSVEEELRQAQQHAAVQAQQAGGNDGPQRIGKRQCIICMENYTNGTVTSCGHYYCHECLVQALIAGEKNSERSMGNCPICRKPLSRTNKKRNDIIPVSFMKKETFRKNGRVGSSTST